MEEDSIWWFEGGGGAILQGGLGLFLSKLAAMKFIRAKLLRAQQGGMKQVSLTKPILRFLNF